MKIFNELTTGAMKKTALFSITLLMGIPVAHITVYAMAFNRDSTAIAGLIPEAI